MKNTNSPRKQSRRPSSAQVSPTNAETRSTKSRLSEGLTKRLEVRTASAPPTPLAHWRTIAAEPFEDASKWPSDDANPMIARNFERIAAHILVLAHLIEKGNDYSDAPSILEAQHLLKQYRETLPALLQSQLEQGLEALPLGDIQMNTTGILTK